MPLFFHLELILECANQPEEDDGIKYYFEIGPFATIVTSGVITSMAHCLTVFVCVFF